MFLWKPINLLGFLIVRFYYTRLLNVSTKMHNNFLKALQRIQIVMFSVIAVSVDSIQHI